MEKSIESIWKEGFLNNNVLVAPKVNDLYNRKSEHIVDKFTRMFKINLIAIVATSFFVLVMAYITGVPYMGIGMFILLNGVVVINKKLMSGLNQINKNVNSFEYLQSFDHWMKEQISINEKMSRFLYPFIFLVMALGFWFGPFGADDPGQALVNEMLASSPDLTLIFGVPLFFWGIGIGIFTLLGFLGGKIYKKDLGIVYGRVLKKLDEILADMEELRE